MEFSKGSLALSGDNDRPLAHFPKTIWENPLTLFSISHKESNTNKDKLRSITEKVKEMLAAASEADPIEYIKLIDTLCRLGVSYHFEGDIEARLEKLFACDAFNQMIREADCDLYTIGVIFQVFRQHGFKLLPDVFDNFKNSEGKFKEDLAADARGMLSLYEAAHWSTHGEEILDEALVFSKSHLEKLSSQSTPHLAIRIKNALKHPYPRGIPRIETRQYISYYEEDDSSDKTLLEFSKLDFNILQMQYREEIIHVFRWYKALELDTKLPFSRNRTVESFLWALGTYFQPKYSRARVLLATIVIILTILDDIYDAYGTLEELEIFTKAICSPHPTSLEGLPESIKYFHHITFEFFDKLEKEMDKEGRPECGHYAKNYKVTAIGYMQEVRWVNKDYVPTFDEYKKNGVYFWSYLEMATGAFLGMEDASIDAFEWLTTPPKLLVSAALIGRLYNDIASYRFEHKRKHVGTSIDCYMKQYGVSWEEALGEIKRMGSDSWKDLNQELMSRPYPFSFPLVMPFLNLSRVIEVYYKDEDIFTHSVFLKDYVVSLIIDSIPI
ncbi:Terpene synthase [Hirschfeldia incana]|nr:Terpene synthase [Hirschfeldia incana]